MAAPNTRSTSPGAVQVMPRGPLGLTGPQRREVKNFLKALLYLSPALIIFLAFVFIPLFQSIKLSTFLTDPLGRAVKFVGTLQYQRLFASPEFKNSLLRSVQFVLYTVPTTLVVAMALALLGNLRLRRIDLFRMIFSITIAVSGATAALIFTYLYQPSLGWLNYILSWFGISPVPWLISADTALLSVALTTVWLSLGLNTVILLAGMQGISEELYESAMIDGATSWSRFRHITLPLLSPTLFFLLIVDSLAAFQVFTQIHVMTSGGPLDSTNTMVYSIYREFYFNGKYGYAAAQSIILFLIILALTIVQFGVVERRVHYD